ncbi:MAG: protein-(glutamine-N5) methyltransferase, release factor-specific, partial [Burkholderiales bacterium]|nr:protein-(glutamine-N5) methyltransferase, release factor-specific [Burkholderiales bacterium]
MKVGEFLKEARLALGDRIEADALLKHVLDVDSAWLIAHSRD